MYTSVLALLFRSLRVDVRSRGTHLVRAVLLVAIYLSMYQAQQYGARIGAPGLSFFSSILWLNLMFLTLIGIGAFSSSITEEKEEDALGLLKMAGVDSLGLLLGKVGGRLMQALAFLVVQYPFTLLAITLGGVTTHQIRAAYISLAAYLLMLAGLGMFCSTIAQTSRSASRLMVLLLALFTIIPTICSSVSAEMTRSNSESLVLPILLTVAQCCLLLQTEEILSTGFQSPFWNVQVISNVLIGLVAFLLSWGLFDRCTRNPTSEPSTRGFVTHKAKGIRLFNPGRPGSNALVWKDFHFATGGIAGLLVRFGAYGSLFLAIVFLFSFRSSFEIREACDFLFWWMVFLLPLDASLLIARSLQDEVRGQTIPALVMLPRSIPSIFYSKLGGALLGLIPGLITVVLAICGSHVMPFIIEHGLERPGQEFGLVLGAVCNLLIVAVLFPCLTAVIALTTQWGATVMALGAMIALYFVEILVLSLFATFFLVGGPNAIGFFLFLVGSINFSLCVACQYEALRRFKILSEK